MITISAKKIRFCDVLNAISTSYVRNKNAYSFFVTTKKRKREINSHVLKIL